MMKVLTASCAASLANTPANSQLMAVIKKNKINTTHSKLQILTKFETTKSIFHSLLIEHLQASIWRELLMFTVLIGPYRVLRVTLAALQRVHKSNLAPFFFVITR